MKAPKVLQAQAARLILADLRFSSNDVTINGDIVIDPTHAQSGRQSGIGAMFNEMARRQLIEFTGDIEASTSPHRKGGMVRIWRGTEAGRLWARNVLGLGR